MSNSYAQTVNWICSQCHQSFTAHVWLIVDIAEQPELLEQILSNTLHNFSCPYCNYAESIDAPLLIYVADSMRELHESPLLFSPEQDTSAEEDREQVVGLLKILRFNLGPIWRDDWLQQVVFIPRHLLADAFSNKLQTRKTDGSRQAADFGYIPPEFIPILSGLAQPASPTDMPNRIQLCRQGIAIAPRDQNPTLWAMLHKELGKSLYQNPLDDRGKNIEQAIEAYEQALQVITRDAMPIEWAQTVNDLGVAYYDRVFGKRADNIKRAIAAHQQALGVMTRDANPAEWAGIMMNLGNAYADNVSGELRENIEQAIGAYQQALQIRTRDAMPTEWAVTMMNLGRAYFKRVHGLRAENIEFAIDAYQQALQVMAPDTTPTEWALTVNNLGIAYVERIRGERTWNLERAIDSYQQALRVRTQTASPIEWAATMMNLANAYNLRILGSRSENLEQAITYHRQALTVRTRVTAPIEWAQTLGNLASVYADRIHGDRVENLEHAITAYEQALTVMTRDAMRIEWAQTMQNLASVYANRIRGGRAENLEQAIAAYKQALTVRTQDAMPVEWAQTMQNLAIAYRNRMRGDQAQNVEAAIAAYQQALTVMTRDAMPIDWAQTMNNLAIAYTDRICGDRAENMEQAIAVYEQALTVMTQDAMPVGWATTMSNLATAYVDRIYGEQAENLKQAIAINGQALQVFTQDTFPAAHRQTQRNLGLACLAAKRWAEAVNAFGGALAAGELLYAVAATPEARQAELSTVRGVLSQMAYAQVRQMDNEGADLAAVLVMLERNRARWLVESLTLRTEKLADVPDALWHRFTAAAAQIQEFQSEAQLPDNTPGKRNFLTLSTLLTTARTELMQTIEEIRTYAPEFMPTPSFADIEAAFMAAGNTQAEIGVYLLTTAQGGLALLVYTGRVIPVWLETFTDELLQTLLHEWFTAYSTFRNQRGDDARQWWFSQIDAVTSRLWEVAMGPIAAALEEQGLTQRESEPPPVVTLIPTGLLPLLPLHTAWTKDDATPTCRRYFIDNYAVHYAPSATALRYCRERAGDAGLQHLLAIDDPKPITGGGPLPNSGREVKAIASLFPISIVLQHQQATHATARSALAVAQVAHFSCHGANNWQNPLDSGLLLAHDELLTVRDILDLRLSDARLATLSACETGMVGADLPDEVVMLPSALVQAGYAGVVASLWSVADVSTAMLMVRFYQFWREEGMAPVYALRAAQRWVRDTINQEKADFFGQFVPGLNPRMADTMAAEFFSAAMTLPEGLATRSFTHPFWWGAFYLTGV